MPMNSNGSPSLPSGDSWLKAYPDAQFSIIHQDNYLPFITTLK